MARVWALADKDAEARRTQHAEAAHIADPARPFRSFVRGPSSTR
jgi:hypothetical protein